MIRLIAPVLALACLALPLSAQEAGDPPVARLSVSGEGEARAVPDMATVTLGVMAEAESAEAALDQTSEVAARILERLAGFEIEERDVQTSNLSLNPVYSDRRNSDGPPEIRGFRASNTLSVRVRDLDRLGEVLGAVTGDGANQLSGLSFGVADPEPLLEAARREAVADARARAELYAEAAGVTLGRVLSLSEQGGGYPGPVPMAELRMAADGAVPVARGETGISAQVSMVFEIRQ